MARIDRVARWVAVDILAERGVARTPAAMRSVMPVSYVVAEGVLRALGEMTGDLAAELAGAEAVICVPAGGADPGPDMAEFEAEFPGDEPDQGGV